MTLRLDGSPVTRRAFLALSAGSTLSASGFAWSSRKAQGQDSTASTAPVGRLWDPARAGRPLPPVTAADNDAAIQAIEKQIHCTCGCNQDVYTCRTTDFTCQISPAMHRRVVALAQAGKTGEQILDEFVREHGIAILMAPPKRGFHLLSYLVPPATLITAGAILWVVLRRWTRAPGRPGDTGPIGSAAQATPEELERLKRELDRLSV
jgi:cytochrome c-type biogenesis protein CcmH